MDDLKAGLMQIKTGPSGLRELYQEDFRKAKDLSRLLGFRQVLDPLWPERGPNQAISAAITAKPMAAQMAAAMM
jgi:hypothetical protein